MSYEGSKQYISEKGNYYTRECNNSIPINNGLCHDGSHIMWWRSVNHANGEISDDPGTMFAETVEVGREDNLHRDHHGNPYYIQTIRVKPADESLWVKVDRNKDFGIL